MTERRPLSEGLKATPTVDPVVAREFIHGWKGTNGTPTATGLPTAESVPPPISRVPISTRIRDDYAKALKRASLERQLKGIEPNTLQDILEQALEPWLRSNGYLT